MIELCNSAAKVAKILVPAKCFRENFVVSKNILFQVLEIKRLKALFIITGIGSPSFMIEKYFIQTNKTLVVYGISSEHSIRNSFG